MISLAPSPVFAGYRLYHPNLEKSTFGLFRMDGMRTKTATICNSTWRRMQSATGYLTMVYVCFYLQPQGLGP